MVESDVIKNIVQEEDILIQVMKYELSIYYHVHNIALYLSNNLFTNCLSSGTS